MLSPVDPQFAKIIDISGNIVDNHVTSLRFYFRSPLGATAGQRQDSVAKLTQRTKLVESVFSSKHVSENNKATIAAVVQRGIAAIPTLPYRASYPVSKWCKGARHTGQLHGGLDTSINSPYCTYQYPFYGFITNVFISVRYVCCS